MGHPIQDMSSTHLCHFQPAPFSFDQRDHEMMVKKEEKIRKVDFVKLRMWSKFKVSRIGQEKKLVFDHLTC